ncbi:MAG: group III truncated hemoglobin [Saprospiraceae bacterium]|nr:group III truncated hemoglobin [Saprospiraceae bacterium]
MKQIETREDIMLLVDTFYHKVRKDPIIQHFFNEVTEIDWKAHMPTMYDFWESLLLDNPVYKGNPMTKHIVLDSKSRMEPQHFDRWIELFHETLDDLFTSEKVAMAKSRSSDIRRLMQFKVETSRS